MDVVKVDKWIAPTINGAPLLCMPNIPKPLHSRAPRTIEGQAKWNLMRTKCYMDADYTCQACGKYLGAGKCLERGTQVLTVQGWKAVEQITIEDRVAQFNPKDSSIEFVYPIATQKMFQEKIYRIGYKNRFRMGVSGDHRVLIKKKSSKNAEIHWETVRAKECKACGKAYQYIPTAGFNRTADVLTPDEKVLIAIHADGNVIRQNSNSKYCSHPELSGMYCSNICVYKERKQVQLLELLKACSLPYTIASNGRRGGLRALIWTHNNPKDFWDCFNVDMGAERAHQFIDELVKWDGWEGNRKGHLGRCWYTTKPHQADFVQAVAVQCGITTTYSVSKRTVRDWGKDISNRKSTLNCLPQINIEFLSKTERGTQTMSMKEEEYNNEVFCITVPSSYFVARTKDNYTFITGNCQAHELYSIDWSKQLSQFERCVCLCKDCHAFIHSGRTFSMYQRGEKLYNKYYLQKIAKKAFEVISAYNNTVPEDQKLRMYGTIMEWLKDKELGKWLEPMINHYNVRLYGAKRAYEDKDHWSKWRLVYHGKKYEPKYKDAKEWQEAMKE